MRQICKSLPVGGERLVWAVVGRKWVRICLPVCNTKFRISDKTTGHDPGQTMLMQLGSASAGPFFSGTIY